MKADIHVRIEKDITDDVRDYAARNGISLAAAVSLLLRRALREEEQS
jgi:antitoxin component of RelBE/YafQ-DinJ toxin-antitoxin module